MGQIINFIRLYQYIFMRNNSKIQNKLLFKQIVWLNTFNMKL
ncbi:hypothetical protein pb186bvf_003426 [Paramecium bursaria]